MLFIHCVYFTTLKVCSTSLTLNRKVRLKIGCAARGTRSGEATTPNFDQRPVIFESKVYIREREGALSLVYVGVRCIARHCSRCSRMRSEHCSVHARELHAGSKSHLFTTSLKRSALSRRSINLVGFVSRPCIIDVKFVYIVSWVKWVHPAKCV